LTECNRTMQAYVYAARPFIMQPYNHVNLHLKASPAHHASVPCRDINITKWCRQAETAPVISLICQ